MKEYDLIEKLHSFVNDLAKKMWGKTQDECFLKEICVCCHDPVELKDEEYWRSALCQDCRPD